MVVGGWTALILRLQDVCTSTQIPKTDAHIKQSEASNSSVKVEDYHHIIYTPKGLSSEKLSCIVQRSFAKSFRSSRETSINATEVRRFMHLSVKMA